MTFLSPYGISVNKAKKIQEAFGVNAVETIKNRPFALCEISGFGFLTVDEIARKINFQPEDPLRRCHHVCIGGRKRPWQCLFARE